MRYVFIKFIELQGGRKVCKLVGYLTFVDMRLMESRI